MSKKLTITLPRPIYNALKAKAVEERCPITKLAQDQLAKLVGMEKELAQLRKGRRRKREKRLKAADLLRMMTDERGNSC